MKDDIRPRNKRIEQLETELYDPNLEHGQRLRRKIHGPSLELEKDFTDNEYERLINAQAKYKIPTSVFKKIFMLVFGFFLITVIVAGVSLYENQQTVSEDLIAMEVIGQPFVDGGEDLQLQIRVQNFNEQGLELPDVIISYPKDSSPDSEQIFLRRALSNVESKGRVTEDFTIELFGQEGDIRDIDVTLEYRIEGSSSIFVKEAVHQVIIRSTPTDLTIEAPDTLVRNQEVALKFNVGSNSIQQIDNTTLRVDYPRGFEFIRSSLPADFNNNIWYFDNLDEPKTIEVVGRLAALEGQGQSFNAAFGKQNTLNKNQIDTVFNAQTHTIEIQKSFIESSIAINGIIADSSSIRGGGDMEVVISYENTLSEALQNIQLVLQLEGELYDPTRISLQSGFFNSAESNILFDETTASQLSTLAPGQRGELRFRLFSKDLVSSAGILANPFVNLSLDVEATRVGGTTDQAFAVASHRVRANSDISVVPKAQYYEGPFDNNGPIPPRVNAETTYTLTFQVINSSNAIENAELSTFLPAYVDWMNAVSPSVERTKVSYDTFTRKLTWNLGEVRAGLGVGTSQPREISMQVRVTPSAIQVGDDLDLTQEITLTGTDIFTQADLSYRKSAVSNRLQDRQAIGADGRVVQ